jgi:MFS transporter, FSR family, fosmidomycin resistance protein
VNFVDNDIAPRARTVGRWRTLGMACLAHVAHDGYSSMIYLLLPFWQHELVLSLAEVGILKTLYSAAMAAGQLPAGALSERRGERLLLLFGTVLTTLAVFALHRANTPLILGLLLVLGGLGASVQHPLASTLIAKGYGGPALRTVLGTYNFAGDLGKMAIPSLLTILIARFGWRSATETISVLGVATVSLLLIGLPQGAPLISRPDRIAASSGAPLPSAARRRGFAALSAIGMLDSATRTGLLTFLPFVLASKGADTAAIGTALSLVFAGGAAGKFACGALASRLGILRTVILSEAATAAAILLTLVLPLSFCLALMPLLGTALNGTSSVLYGTVPELAPAGREAHAFGLFYTVTISADAVAPTLYGAIGDWFSLVDAMMVVAAVVLLIAPLTALLHPALRQSRSPS